MDEQLWRLWIPHKMKKSPKEWKVRSLWYACIGLHIQVMLFYMFVYRYVESRPVELKHFLQTTVFVPTEQMQKDWFSSNNSPLRFHLLKLILISFHRRPRRRRNGCTELSKRVIHWCLRSQKNGMVSSLITKVKHDKLIRTKAQWVCSVHRQALWVSLSIDNHSQSKSHSRTSKE